MSIGPLSQCGTCARLRPPLVTGMRVPSCEAFPAGIPDVVFQNGRDHRYPIDGDGGVRWQSNGEEFPEWAFVKKFLGPRR